MSKNKREHRPQHNPSDSEKAERRKALEAIRTVMRNSVSSQAAYDGRPFDETLARFIAEKRTIAGIFFGMVAEGGTHPNKPRFKAFGEAAAKYNFTWNDLALRELNLTPAESAVELHRVTRERDALRVEAESLRGGRNVAAEVAALIPLASRAFRVFYAGCDGAQYDPEPPKPADAPIDVGDPRDDDAMPSILLAYNMAAMPGTEWLARVEFYQFDPDVDEEEAAELTLIAFGDPSASPSEALATLRLALEQEPGEDGMRVTPEAGEYFAGCAQEESIVNATPSNQRPN